MLLRSPMCHQQGLQQEARWSSPRARVPYSNSQHPLQFSVQAPPLWQEVRPQRPGESTQLRSAPREMQAGLGGGLSAVSMPTCFPLGPLCWWPWSGWGLCLLTPTGSVDTVGGGGGGRKRELGRSYQELSLVSGHSFFTARLSSVCLLKGSREYLCSAQRGWPLSTFPLLPFPITTSEAPVIYTSQDALLQLLHDGSSLHH